jgi:hypothetical protein
MPTAAPFHRCLAGGSPRATSAGDAAPATARGLSLADAAPGRPLTTPAAVSRNEPPAPWRARLSRRAFLRSTAATVPALLVSTSVMALAAAAPGPVPVPVLKPMGPRGEPRNDGTYWDDGSGWVS